MRVPFGILYLSAHRTLALDQMRARRQRRINAGCQVAFGGRDQRRGRRRHTGSSSTSRSSSASSSNNSTRSSSRSTRSSTRSSGSIGSSGSTGRRNTIGSHRSLCFHRRRGAESARQFVRDREERTGRDRLANRQYRWQILILDLDQSRGQSGLDQRATDHQSNQLPDGVHLFGGKDLFVGHDLARVVGAARGNVGGGNEGDGACECKERERDKRVKREGGSNHEWRDAKMKIVESENFSIVPLFSCRHLGLSENRVVVFVSNLPTTTTLSIRVFKCKCKRMRTK